MNLHKLLFPKVHEELQWLKFYSNEKDIDIRQLQELVERLPTRESLLAEIAESKKPDWKENLEFIFDIEGKKYYKFIGVEALPLNRLQELQVLLIELDNRLTRSEMETLIKIGRNAFTEAFEAVKAGK